MATALPEGGVAASPLTRSSPSSRVCLREPAKGRGWARGRLAGLPWQRGLGLGGGCAGLREGAPAPGQARVPLWVSSAALTFSVIHKDFRVAFLIASILPDLFFLLAFVNLAFNLQLSLRPL